jgi:hypothetical protein
VPGPCLRARRQLRLRARGGRARDLRLQERQGHPDPAGRRAVHKLLATGKTDLLENFVSNKTRRKFKAFLAYDKKEGKVGFEFEPRAPKAPAKKAARKTTAAE